jgi:hypothetical protein
VTKLPNYPQLTLSDEITPNIGKHCGWTDLSPSIDYAGKKYCDRRDRLAIISLIRRKSQSGALSASIVRPDRISRGWSISYLLAKETADQFYSGARGAAPLIKEWVEFNDIHRSNQPGIMQHFHH